jgi:hypothetical protein
MYNLAKQIVMKDKSRIFSVFITAAVKLLRDQTELIKYEAISIKYYECLYSCPSYPACKSHHSCATLYCRLWPVWLSHIFPYYLINGTILRQTLLNIKCVF